ncbi:S8 family serine peptidase, partial [Paenibacillus sp. SI8]|uniref:S8 family peptidase n=1 Tax=unclassified Paenibacillus TaxID=185978 RepID=UPI003465E0BC
MKKKMIPFMLSLAILFSLISPAFAAAQDSVQKNNPRDKSLAGSYIIKFKDAEKGKQALNKRTKRGLQQENQDKKFKHFSSHITTTLSSAEVEELKKDSNVAYIEKDSVVKKTGDIVTPNLNQIHVPEVQNQGVDGTGVKVAILDTGINTHSSELHVSGGASFVTNDTSLDDANGHGTFMAGILAALKDEHGLVGVAPNVNLYNVKVLDSNGEGTYSQVIQGIDWAIDNHMDIVAMSFAGTEYSSALEEAMQLAFNNGILLVAATGNDGANTVSYPAKLPSVIGVGAVDGSNQLAAFSNTGAGVELVAPGVNIQGLSLTGSNYITMSGTSMAVPQVAGVAALIKSRNYTYTNQDIRQALDGSATALGNPKLFGKGLVNAAAILNIPAASNPTTVTGDVYGGTVTQSVYDSVYIEQRKHEISIKFDVTTTLIDEKLMKGYA